ncbi:SMP-30/gluconolactonase/LRE family protein [Arsenicitalea aurantiaca]|uniref:SMP-30/gluconolactonase/LRE family protein n=2 Tax=Arsenicitalea aurantiaca TaxID=1783274 RepID=A0A433XBJ9_9HYPH|nr:SMP-30/gluconolactonase/LRE family protein [Arsenicitalea aurantiaca]
MAEEIAADITPLLSDRFEIGESPVWDEAHGSLLWCDIPRGEIHALRLEDGKREAWRFGEPVGAFGLCRSRRLVVGLRDSVILFDRASGNREMLAALPHRKPRMRLNDGKVGPDGAFYIGSMDASGDGAPAAAFYRVGPDGAVRVLADGYTTTNGLAWSPDGRLMYHSDSRGPMALDRWDFDPATGEANGRVRLGIIDETLGRADGGACDLNGDYWSAAPSQSRLNQFDAEGQLVGFIPMPTLRPTMPCFGGSDMRTLFVTSLSSGIDAETLAQHPLCGAIVTLRMPVAGVPVSRFAD